MQLKNKASVDKVEEANKANDSLKVKEEELQSKLAKLTQDMEVKNKASMDKIEEAHKANELLKAKQQEL